MLAAISGIDGSGKGYVTGRIVDVLQAKGLSAVAINVDGWLNLPEKRFDAANPAEHFYLHAIRFEELFAEYDVKSSWPLWVGLHTCYNGRYKG